MSGNVDMIAVFFMIIGAMFGAQFGSIATSFVRGPAIRYILSYSLILATTGAFLRLIYMLSAQQYGFLNFLAVVFTLGEMIFLCLFIMSLVVFCCATPSWQVGPSLGTVSCCCERIGGFLGRCETTVIC